MACTSANPCRLGAIECPSGACVDTRAAPEGTSCPGGACQAGECAQHTCLAGESCQPSNPCTPGVACDTGNPCTKGVTACDSPTSTPTCVVASNTPNGTQCGTLKACNGTLKLICDTGTCIQPDLLVAQCQPDDPCYADGFFPAGCCIAQRPSPDGTVCGPGLVCTGGHCNPAPCVPDVTCPKCVAGSNCFAGECIIGRTVCDGESSAPRCVSAGVAPDGTLCAGQTLSCSEGECLFPTQRGSPLLPAARAGTITAK